MPMTAIIRLEEVENKIIEIRNQKVLLDIHVAQLYEVETKEIAIPHPSTMAVAQIIKGSAFRPVVNRLWVSYSQSIL